MAKDKKTFRATGSSPHLGKKQVKTMMDALKKYAERLAKDKAQKEWDALPSIDPEPEPKPTETKDLEKIND
jgi:hypothetical protein